MRPTFKCVLCFRNMKVSSIFLSFFAKLGKNFFVAVGLLVMVTCVTNLYFGLRYFHYFGAGSEDNAYSVCPNKLPPLPDSEGGPRFHIIQGNDEAQPALVLYSARYDSTQQSVVIVGFFDWVMGPLSKVFCSFEYPRLQERQASQQLLNEDQGRRYGGILFICKVKNWKPTPFSVVHVKAIFFSSSGNATLRVQFAKSKEIRPSVAACVGPLRYEPGSMPETRFILRLVEFIEVSRILGIEHFYFYNWSLPLNISRTLRQYAASGLVTIHQWSLPIGFISKNHIHYFGQMVTINDCLYEVRDQYELATFIDIDEFLVPVSSDGTVVTLKEAARLHGLTTGVQGAPCALGFRHGLFPLMSDDRMAKTTNWKKLPIELKGCHVATLLYNQREKKMFDYPERAKTLVVARQIKTMGIHFVWNTWTGCQTKVLDPDKEGFTHHLRKSFDTPVKEFVEETSLQRIKEPIESAMARARIGLAMIYGYDICR